MAASLPRRGTTSPCFYSDVSCAGVTSGKNIRRNMFCVNELVTIMDYKKNLNWKCTYGCRNGALLFFRDVCGFLFKHIVFVWIPQNLLRMWSWYINQYLCNQEDWSTRETGATSTPYPFTLSADPWTFYLFGWTFQTTTLVEYLHVLTFGWATSFWLGLKAKEH